MRLVALAVLLLVIGPALASVEAGGATMRAAASSDDPIPFDGSDQGGVVGHW